MTDPIQAAYDAAEARYKAANPISASAHAVAAASLPGGNTRSVLHWSPYPLCIAHASGYTVRDVDGHEYVDLLGEYSAGIYGHSHPVLLSALTETATKGLGYGGPHQAEARLAGLIKERFESIERIRFTNSGTEANLLAIAAAKAFTGRNRGKVLVFEGGYHGGLLVFPYGCRDVWMKGVGEEERGETKGKFEALRALNAPHDFLVATYNDINSVDAVIASPSATHNGQGQGDDGTAAILLEPMLGSGGGVCATPSFLAHLRRRADEIGALLIFDEVMTSRMHSGGGLQNCPQIQGETKMKVKPDITTLGKYIGGGMSFGAFGGREDVMAVFDPRKEGSLPHAGTFNNNVFTMNVGAKGLEEVFTREKARELHGFGEEVRTRLNYLGERYGHNSDTGDGKVEGEGGKGRRKLRALGCGSILSIHFTATEPKDISNPADWNKDEDTRLLDLFHLEMLNEGFYLARRGYIALNIMLLVEEGRREMDRFADAVERFLGKFGRLLRLSKGEGKVGNKGDEMDGISWTE